MRCPDCNKFVSLEPGDPEVEVIEINGQEVSATVRIVLACAECGTELKEYKDELTELLGSRLTDAAEYTKHFDQKGEPKTEDCELEVNETDCSATEQQEGKGRKARTLYGAEVSYEVTCACQDGEALCEGNLESSMTAASDMDECC